MGSVVSAQEHPDDTKTPSKVRLKGTTEGFCGSATVPEPNCGGSSSDGRTVGYYEGWNLEKSCGSTI